MNYAHNSIVHNHINSLSSLFSASIGWSPGDSLCLSPQVSPPPTQHSACPASLARPAFLFLILYLLSSRKLPKIPFRLPIRCPSSVLCLPLDPLGLENFLLVFWISSLILDEILGEPCREPENRPAGNRNKFIHMPYVNRFLRNILVFTYTLPY